MKATDRTADRTSRTARPRRWRLAIGLLLGALLVLAVTNSCTSTVTPPVSPANPCEAYLLKDARHIAVVLPDAVGDYVEYGFGDWDWYAELHDSWYHVFDTVLWPTQGCLGRRALSRAHLARLERRGAARAIVVNSLDAADLRGDLEKRFDAHRQTLVHNPVYGLDFVMADRGYWFLHNCHDAVADWLEMLGCDVSWALIRFGVELEE